MNPKKAGGPGLFDDQLASASARTAGRETPPPDAPLAERMRPRELGEVLGQEEILGERRFLRRAIEQDRVVSLVFWGPPGSGKTTLARLIASETDRPFLPFSAVTSGIKEIKEVMAEAERLRRSGGRAPLLFVDEIHRFNRAQQDAFLPYVEHGDVVLVGATTENPSFELNAALLSRCRVVLLEALDPESLRSLLERALKDEERGLGRHRVEAESAALDQIVQLSSGDARRALNLLELVITDVAAEGREQALEDDVVRAAQRKVLLYDKAGEEHFNLISALHKSLRESDPDAAVYWLIRMLESGEDPGYVARRMLRFASEDIGLAEPDAVGRTLAAWQAFDRLGPPEGYLSLVQAALYLAMAPKSIAAYQAEKAARRAIRERPADPVPMSIRNAPTRLMKTSGYGSGHTYAPDTEEGIGGMPLLPDAIAGTRFYEPADSGFEKRLRERLREIDEQRRKAQQRWHREQQRGAPRRDAEGAD